MPGGFRPLAGITADVGLEAWGDDLPAAFAAALEGLADLLCDPATVRPAREVTLSAQGDLPEYLLVNLLNEAVYLFATERFLPARVEGVSFAGDTVTARVAGEPFDPARHLLRFELKAATWHRMAVVREPAGWRATVIFDV